MTAGGLAARNLIACRHYTTKRDMNNKQHIYAKSVYPQCRDTQYFVVWFAVHKRRPCHETRMGKSSTERIRRLLRLGHLQPTYKAPAYTATRSACVGESGL